MTASNNNTVTESGPSVVLSDSDQQTNLGRDCSKIHWSLKWSTYALSVLSLSLFFAGWRQLHQAQTFGNWLTLLAGVVFTLFLTALQGYWIYFDEKAKGALRKRISIYEKIHSVIGARSKLAVTACSGDGGKHDGQG